MDQRTMIGRISSAVAGLLLLSGAAGAHPHSYVDQQALISVGQGSVELRIFIAPSFEDGAAIFAHIDADKDGIVSDAEAVMFGTNVVSKAMLAVDDLRVVLNTANVAVPDKDLVSTGSGMITIVASAAFGLRSSGDHRLDFDISYEHFSHDWFIQPFFYRDFIATTSSQVVERTNDDNSRITITFSSENSR